jgi:hypothetical protein
VYTCYLNFCRRQRFGGPRPERSHLNRKNLGIMAHSCLSTDGRKLKIVGSWSRLAWPKARLYLQNNQNKRAGGVAEVVECLPHKVLSSNPTTSKIKKKEKERKGKKKKRKEVKEINDIMSTLQ